MDQTCIFDKNYLVCGSCKVFVSFAEETHLSPEVQEPLQEIQKKYWIFNGKTKTFCKTRSNCLIHSKSFFTDLKKTFVRKDKSSLRIITSKESPLHLWSSITKRKQTGEKKINIFFINSSVFKLKCKHCGNGIGIYLPAVKSGLEELRGKALILRSFVNARSPGERFIIVSKLKIKNCQILSVYKN